MPSFPSTFAAALAIFSLLGGRGRASEERFFQEKVQPILERRCFECHSHDAGKMKGGLTLDSRSGWADGGESGPALVPGDPDGSLLIQAVRRVEKDSAMPPKKALPAEEIAILEQWVRAGAPDPRMVAPAKKEWWALKPMTKPTPPGPPGRNPIDAFLEAHLAAKNLPPAPPASARHLVRRLTFDLIGLPPTPEEVAAFVAASERDPQTAARELTDRLLASPRHGERWARHWMDVAHFAETHGHDQDRIRENAWPYRDYLITALNADKPFARFAAEQIAGDILFPHDPQSIVALGFLAAGPWDESSLRDIREDTLDRQIARYLDRDDVVSTVMQTFASVTVQCARCHDHKFDPISQRDYYALQAVFAGVDRANRRYDADPAVAARRGELQAQLAAIARREPALLLNAETQRDAEAFANALLSAEAKWRPLDPEIFVSAAGATLTKQPDGSLLASGRHGPTDTYSITAPSPAARVTAIRLEVLDDDSLPQRGPGREANGNLHLSEIQLLAFEPGAPAARVVALRNPTADFNQDGWTITHALDGDEKTAWGIFPQVGHPHVAVFELAEALTLPAGSKLTVVLKQLHGGHCIGRPRLSVTDVENPARAAAVPGEIRAIVQRPGGERDDAQRTKLGAWFLQERATRELAALPRPSLVFAAASDFEPDGSHQPAGAPRPVQVLKRGDIQQPVEAASPGALSCVAQLPARFNASDEGARRAALAQWITDRENPFAWRSIVNRVWHYHFGRGLVETPNDFGRMGAAPSHPALLDWLAVWFRDDARGSLKELHRLIVTSDAYRRSTAEIAGAAPNDFASFPRLRLDAECVRDAILSISGRLDLRMGGPSDRQFDLQPGIHVTPRVDYAKFDLDSAAARRRSVYRFLFRTLPDPFMEALDCPAGDQLTPVRSNTVTVQQSLALWNSPWIAHHAEHFAARVAPLAPDLDAQISAACEHAIARPPSPEEAREFAAYARRHGLAALCRVLLNADEFIFLN